MIYEGSIRKKLILIIMSVTLVTALIGYTTFVYWYMEDQYKRAINLSKTMSLVLGQDFAKLILLNDVSAAADITSSLKSFSNIDSMVLYNLEKKPILQYSIDNNSFKVEALPPKEQMDAVVEDDVLKLYIEANYKETKLGFAQLQIHISTIYDVIEENIYMLLLILFIMFIISYILATYFARRFTSPILDLVTFLDKIDLAESLKSRIQTEENNEYGKLYEGVNTMLERLESSHKILKLAAVTFDTQNGITITDKDQKILHVNKAFTTITGYTAQEAIGQTPRILQSGVHTKEFYDDMRRYLKEHHFWMGEINNKHKDGSIVNEHLTIQVVLDDDGEVLYYVGSFLDITLQKDMESELREKENLLIQQSKMAAMGEMLENIAHQWKQPLSIISTTTSGLVLKKDLDLPLDKDEEVKQLSTITDTVQFLAHTIDDFREFFKPNKKKEKFNLKECYKKVANLVNLKFLSLNIQIIEDLDDVNIVALENELKQVIINILNNSRDALENMPGEKFIFVHVYRENQKAYLVIKDNGGGIPSAIINRIFDPYFTTKGEQDGTGIGLHMSKEMIEKHIKGKISVTNEYFAYEGKKYKGAQFTIEIPTRQ